MGDLSTLGAETRGVWTRQAALTVTSRSLIDAAIRDGAWQVLWPGIYADGGILPDCEQLAFAAVLASGRGAVAAGRTAARVHGLPLIDDDDPATGASEHLVDDVIGTGHGSLRHGQNGETRVLLRRQRRLAAGDVVRLSGLRVTSVVRTMFDCAALLSHAALVCAMDNALQRRLSTRAELEAAVARAMRRPGAAAFRAAAAVTDGRAESPAETLTRLLLRPHLPALEPQVELYDDYGRLLARFDLADRAARIAVEADGKRGHAGSQMVAKDQARDRRTAARGWRTERTTWFELRRQQDQLVSRVVAQHDTWRARAA